MGQLCWEAHTAIREGRGEEEKEKACSKTVLILLLTELTKLGSKAVLYKY